MSFNNIIGQHHVKRILQGAIRTNRVSHAYLFEGPKGVGKQTTAMVLAKAINCLQSDIDSCDSCIVCKKIDSFNHPDVKLVFPTPSTIKPEEIGNLLQQKAKNRWMQFKFSANVAISISDIRNIQKSEYYKPFEANKKVVIITDADKLTLEAANALLKVLEEPPSNTIWILTTAKSYALPTTILSRCQKIKFARLKHTEIIKVLTDEVGVEPSQARNIAQLSQGSLGTAIELSQQNMTALRQKALEIFTTLQTDDFTELLKTIDKLAISRDREDTLKLIDFLIEWYRDLLILNKTDDTSQLYDLDLIDKFYTVSNKYSFDVIKKNIYTLEYIKSAVIRNVNLPLAWTILMLKLSSGGDRYGRIDRNRV